MPLASWMARCEVCRHTTPHDRRGHCRLCRRRERRALRAVKRSAIGANLPRFAQVRKLADDLVSVWIRARAPGCAMCGAALPPEALQWAHHRTRGLRGLRYHPLNYSALCGPCHVAHSFGRRRQEWESWLLEERLGAADYERLGFLERVRGRLSVSDCQLAALEARQGIAALPPGPRRAWARAREEAILERAA